MIQDRTLSSRIFDIVIYAFLTLVALITAFPLVFCIIRSFEGGWTIASGLDILPKQWSVIAYITLMKNPFFLKSLWISCLITIIGTLISLALTSMLAYGLSRKQFIGKRLASLFVVFTMLFSGGLIPSYMVVRNLGILNTLWAIIIPNAMGAYTFLIMRSYFLGLPDSLDESARIDGAGDLRIYWQIYLPLAKPMLAAVSLLYVVRQWNLFFDAIIYIRDNNLWPLQVLVRQAIIGADALGIDGSGLADGNKVNPETLKLAAIVISALPMLMIYPFFQKFFIQGMTLGAIKG